MFRLVLQKIFSNSWKVLSLLLGSILVVGMVCSVPIYSNAILQRLLTRDLENAQTQRNRHPGFLVLDSNYNYVSSGRADQLIPYLEQEHQRLVDQMPVEPEVVASLLQSANLYHVAPYREEMRRRPVTLGYKTDFADYINIVRGRMHEPGVEDGVVEVILSEEALESTDMYLDREFELYSYRQTGEDVEPLFTARVVGIYEPKDYQDLYWRQGSNSFSQTLVMEYDDLWKLVSAHEQLSWSDHTVFSAYDYYQFRIQDVGQLNATHRAGAMLGDEQARTTRVSNTFNTVVEDYVQREAELKLTMQILIVPILLMLVFYIFMVSQLMVRSEAHVISVLESRGAGKRQILALYGLESLILGSITFAIGPFLGLWMVRVIGAANGFLEFVDRAALNAQIDRQALLYGGVAVVLFMVTTQLPVYIEARRSIVEQKRKKTRLGRPPLWQRIFLDLILSAISIYALFNLRSQLDLQRRTGTTALDMNLDFLLFLASTLFILGFGLLSLRLYPYVLRFIYWLGRRLWTPVLYASFHQIGRSNGQEQFLMIFLILALSIGLFNANAARTINSNTEDTIHSEVGADIKLQEYWQPFNEEGFPIVDMVDTGSSISLTSSAASNGIVRYHEPNFNKYKELSGIENAARVLRLDNTRIRHGGERSAAIDLMAIDPYDFAQTAWSRSDILRYHMNDYMNVMLSMPNGVILSSDLRDEFELQVGDPIIYAIEGRDNADGVIIAFVDYWPGYRPLTLDSDGSLRNNSLIVANYETVLSNTGLRPYEVWLRRTPEATDAMVYEAIEEDRINVQSIRSANQDITRAKNDPQLQGTNGALTLGFIVSMLVCAIGFLIYWIMAVQSRVLQFGIFRAMGMSKMSVIGMLITEQVLVSGAAVLLGVVLGNLTSYFFVPLFQIVYSSADQPIPFRIISDPSDALKVYIVLGGLLLLCVAVLIRLILRIRIDQAVKLGED